MKPILAHHWLATIPESEFKESLVSFFLGRVRNPNTFKAYRNALGRFLAWLGERTTEVTLVRPAMAAVYAAELGQKYAPSTVKQHLAALSEFYSHLATQGHIEHNPFSVVKRPRISMTTGKTPALTVREVKKLIGSIGDSPVEKRDKALLLVLLYSWLRISAALNLRRRDVVETDGSLWLNVVEKRSKHRTIPLHPHARRVFEDYLAELGEMEPDSFVFQSWNRLAKRFSGNQLNAKRAYEMIRRRTKAIGIQDRKIGCHSTRVTACSTYLSTVHGASIDKARELGGWAKLETVRLYDRRCLDDHRAEVEKMSFA